MRSRKLYLVAALFAVLECIFSAGCASGQARVASKNELINVTTDNHWTKVTDSAAFPGAYNFPVFVVRDQMWAFHPKGNWYSVDGRNWIESNLPLSGLISGYQRYIQFNDAVYALGTMTGNYLDMHLTSRIARTADFKHWETIADSSELPARVFYGAVVFKGKIWLMGGYDGKHYYNDVWSSSDGVHWSRIAERTAWSPRTIATTVVFRDKIWIFGGDVIDGQPTDGQPAREVWTSTDGINWIRETDHMNPMSGGSPVVFDNKLWLVGANRDGAFSRAVLVSDDGLNWKEESAPWTPRGAVAVWTYHNSLYITGGKYSFRQNGEITFVYNNDVWSMQSRDTMGKPGKIKETSRS